MAKFIQLFRNQLNEAFANKTAAKEALEQNNIRPNVLKDGMPIIARYYTNGPGSELKTLLGIAHNDGTTVKVTVFDSGSIDELDATISAATDGGTQITIVQTDGVLSSVSLTDIDLETLSNYDKGSDSGSVTSADTISEAIAKLENQIDSKLDALDSDITASANTYFSKIAIVDGKLDSTGSTQTNIDAAQIVDYTKMTTGAKQSLSTGDTIDSAIEKLEWNIDLVENKVDDLDFTGVTNETSKVITDVTETDGLVAASATSVSDLTLSTITTADTKVAVDDSLGDAIGKLQGQIDSMDLSVVSGAGQAIVSVSESDGKVSATTGDIAAEHVTIADADEAFSATTVEGALAELAGKVSANEIESSGKTIVIATGASKTNIEVNIDGDTIIKDANGVLSADVSIVKTTTGLPEAIKERYQLQTSSGTTLGANIDVPKDSHIVSIRYITDSSDAHYQNLEYVYIDASGNTKTEYVDISSLVLEAEFASGVTVTNHVAHGVVDSASEKDSSNNSFLTVGADGFKVSGIKDEIGAAISGLDVSDTAVAGKYVSEVSETDGKISVQRADVSAAVLNNYTKGSDATAVAATDSVNQAISKLENQVDAAKAAATTKVEKDTGATHLTLASTTGTSGDVTYTIGENDIASASALTQEISDREDGDTALSNRLGDGVTSANTATAQLTALSGDSQSTSADTSVEGAKRYADAIVGDIVDGLDATVTGATSGNHVTISIEELDGKLVQSGLTIEESDIASASALTAEIAARKAVDGQNGDTYAANTGAAYISGATSLNNADVLLDTALKTVDDNMLTSISGGSAITVSNKANKNQSIELKLDTNTTENQNDAQYVLENKGNVLRIKEDGLYLDSSWDCGFYSSPANP
jgi:hypothetical protein